MLGEKSLCLVAVFLVFYAGLLIKEKTPIEGKEFVKKVGLHSSFICTAIQVSITFEKTVFQ